jgi:hypothetical protein
MKKLLPLLLIHVSFVCLNAYSQVNNSIYLDSSSIVAWASNCEILRGYLNIADPDLGYVAAGEPNNALGIADGVMVSLGDGGMATLTFVNPIYNGGGPDFAVFENALFSPPQQSSLAFCELAFVEVSSDGINFFRFPSVSNQQTETQIGGYGAVEWSLYYNLAGIHPMGYGTPFDLDELSDIQGLNIQRITHIRLIDVVGSINPDWGSTDSNGIIINDPYPTAFDLGGFDLDAVAVINQLNDNSIEDVNIQLRCYPNPANKLLFVSSVFPVNRVEIFNTTGKCVLVKHNDKSIEISSIPPGIYVLKIYIGTNVFIKKIIKN